MGVSKAFEIWDDRTKSFIPLPLAGASAPGPAPRDFRSCLLFSASSLNGAPSPATASPVPTGGQAQGPTYTLPSAVPLGGHLHYGGSTLSNGKKSYKNGSQPEKGVQFKMQKRMELIVRLENAAIPDPAIAQMLCITPIRLFQIKKSASYLQARMKITLGLVVEHEASLADIKARRKEVLTAMLPQALQVIANTIQNPDPSIAAQKLRVATAQDLLDREGTYAKVSRSEVKPVDHFDWETADQNGRSIFDVLRGSSRQTVSATIKHEIEDTIELSRAFSNSKTLDPVQQQAALEDLERETLAALPNFTERIQ